ncbi:hypothetical protein DFH09DRAFT_1143117 [Mycena vulgaris]|nr:hypothetical protein DFH09DRAFT_1143117 [Mycena vulgaris]
MSAFATFCNLPVSTSFNPDCERSLLALEWIFSSGISARDGVASGTLSLPCNDSGCTTTMHLDLAVTSALPYDLVLGHPTQVVGQCLDTHIANLLLRLITKYLPDLSHGCRRRACYPDACICTLKALSPGLRLRRTISLPLSLHVFCPMHRNYEFYDFFEYYP